MAVRVSRGGKAGVAEHPRHDGQFLALFEPERCAAMAQIPTLRTGRNVTGNTLARQASSWS